MTQQNCNNCGQQSSSAIDGNCKNCQPSIPLRGRYQVAHPLGSGGFGRTFLGIDLELPHTPKVTIKVLRQDRGCLRFQSLAQKLFKHEAGALSRAGQHPQVPRLLDWFELAGKQYLIQEYIPGITLAEEFRQHGHFNEDSIRQVLQQILGILSYLQDQKIVHRDIKPQNLMRHALNQQIMLIDFGVAQLPIQPGSSPVEETASYPGGTLGYSAPEHFVNGSTNASDLYSLGATCVFLLRGIKPRYLPVHLETGRLLWDDPKLNLSARLRKVLNLMLSLNPKERTSASQLQAMLCQPATRLPQRAWQLGNQRLQCPSFTSHPSRRSSEQTIALALQNQLQTIDTSIEPLLSTLKKIGDKILTEFCNATGGFDGLNRWQNLPGISSELDSILRGLLLGEFSSVDEVQSEIDHYFQFHMGTINFRPQKVGFRYSTIGDR
jgi:serine/threonine protein kinase